MNGTIREAAEEDSEALIALSKATIDANYRPFLGDDGVDAFLNSGAIEEYVKENLKICFVILNGDEIKGYSVIKENLIDLMMIEDTAIGQGLGTQLLNYVEGELFENHKGIKVESFEGNKQANDFYLKNGWKQEKIYTDPDSGANKVLFVKVKED